MAAASSIDKYAQSYILKNNSPIGKNHNALEKFHPDEEKSFIGGADSNRDGYLDQVELRSTMTASPHIRLVVLKDLLIKTYLKNKDISEIKREIKQMAQNGFFPAAALLEDFEGWTKTYASVKKSPLIYAAGKISDRTVDLNNSMIGQDLEIFIPAIDENNYASITEMRKGQFNLDKVIEAGFSRDTKNPLLSKVSIPIASLMHNGIKLGQNGVGLRIEIAEAGNLNKYYSNNKSKVVYDLNLILNRSGESLPALNQAAPRQIYLDLLKQALSRNGVARSAYVINAHKDNPESYLAFNNSGLVIGKPSFNKRGVELEAKTLKERMLQTLKLGFFFDKTTAEHLTSILLAKPAEIIPTREDQDKLRLLAALSDKYFFGSGGALTEMQKAGWKMASRLFPEPKWQEEPGSGTMKIISPVAVYHFEKRITPEKFRGALKTAYNALPPPDREKLKKGITHSVTLEFYTDTVAGFNAAMGHIADDSLSGVFVQSHRKVGAEQYAEHYYAHHPVQALEHSKLVHFNCCTSIESITKYVREKFGDKLYAPTGITGKAFATGQVSAALTRTLALGFENEDDFLAAARRAYPGNPQTHGKITEKIIPNRLDRDRDGLPNNIDPEPSRENSTYHDGERLFIVMGNGGVRAIDLPTDNSTVDFPTTDSVGNNEIIASATDQNSFLRHLIEINIPIAAKIPNILRKILFR